MAAMKSFAHRYCADKQLGYNEAVISCAAEGYTQFFVDRLDL